MTREILSLVYLLRHPSPVAGVCHLAYGSTLEAIEPLGVG